MTQQLAENKLISLGEIINRQTGLVVPEDRRYGLEEGVGSIARRFGFRDPETCLDWLVKTDGIDLKDRSLFYAPFAMDPSSAGVLYLGTHRVYRTADRGEWWQAISGDLTLTR